MRSSSIERLRFVVERHRYAIFYVAGLAVFASIHLLRINRNLLYLCFLGAFYIVLLALVKRVRLMVAYLVICALFGMRMPAIPKGRFIDLARPEETDSKGYPIPFAPLRTGETWVFTFITEGLEKHRQECGGGLTGRLIIDGLELAGLEISVERNPVRTVDFKPGSKHFLDHYEIPLEKNLSGEIEVRLTSKPGTLPRIYLGSEALGFDTYPHAVWLEFRNDNCSVLYHARQRIEK